MIGFAIGFWCGGALLTFYICEASIINRLFSSVFWFTFPFWRPSA